MYYDAQWLVSQIEAYDTIVIFRHILADADALGSQFGLKTWIEDNYPDKHVYAVGDSVGASAEHYPSMDRVQDTVIQQALAVVLDTSTAARNMAAAIRNITPSTVRRNTVNDSTASTAAKIKRPPTSRSIETGIQFP